MAVKLLQTEEIIRKSDGQDAGEVYREVYNKKKGLHNAPELGYSVYMRCYAIKEEIFL